MTQLAVLKLDRVFSPMLGMELASDATPHFSLFESDPVSTSRDDAGDASEGFVFSAKNMGNCQTEKSPCDCCK